MGALTTLPLQVTDTSLLGGTIPSVDSGINLASSGSLLDNIASAASSIGSTVSGVLNSIRFGTGTNGLASPVTAQSQAVAGSLSIGTIAVIGLVAYYFMRRKK